MSKTPIQLIAATRHRADCFHNDTLLGHSLQQPQHASLLPVIAYANQEPLAVHYNRSINEAPAEAVLVFCHDDLDLGPDNLTPALEMALARFDLVGVAGNQRCQSGQMAWHLEGSSLRWDQNYLSGSIDHGRNNASAALTTYGPTPMPVELLDGVFLAAQAARLKSSGVRFDPRFAFHFYDLDLCRSARQQKLLLGTWPLKLRRARDGDLFSSDWLDALERYQSKWNEPRRSADIDRYVQFRQGRSFERSRQWKQAGAVYRELLTAQPRHAGLLLRLATVKQQLGQPRESLRNLDAALAIDPTLARAHAKRGSLLLQSGDLDGGAQALRQALTLQPSLQPAADALLLLARQLQSMGHLSDAVEIQRAVLRAAPTRPDMLLELGSSLMLQGKVEAAKACFARLVRHHPDYPGARYQLALALDSLGRVEEALPLHHQALADDSESAEVRLALELLRMNGCDWDGYDNRMRDLQASIEAWLTNPAKPALSPLRVLYFPLPPSLLRRISERWSAGFSQVAATLSGKSTATSRHPARRSDKRLRIGYLSADFRDHAMGNLIAGLFRHHDRHRFEVFIYAINDLVDAVTHSIEQSVEHFTVVATDTNTQLVDRIRGDQLDVLIDLMGHTHHSRPGVLAQRPAPIQLHYLGFPGSLGCDFIDGVIADHWLIPAEHENQHHEMVHRLPWGIVTSAPVIDQSNALATPATTRREIGLPDNAVVCASFNRAEKITPAVFDHWLEILRQVPQAVIWMINDQPLVERRLRDRLTAAKLDSSRLVITPTVDSASFSQICGLADLLLDTSPYGSGATAAIALAAGLPLLTCPSDTFASRMGASLCAAAGLEELICPNPEAYIALAIELGQNPDRLHQLRRQLLERHNELPLFNTAGWVDHLEQLLEQLVAVR